MADYSEDEKAPLGVWIGLTIIAAVSFYAQAAVTEERFVPALNMIATEFRIPSDVAGATLMAAGASSPELFSSIVSLFITHSALGLGTIVGSEIFNQLVICAGAVFAAREGKLTIDRAIVTREVMFYAISIAGLLYSLHDIEPLQDDPLGPNHIFISFFDATVLTFIYVLYVMVCANFNSILEFLSGRRSSKMGFMSDRYGTIGKSSRLTEFHLPRDIPYVYKSFQQEPSGNFKEEDPERWSKRSVGINSSRGGSFLELSARSFMDKTIRLFNLQVDTERPTDYYDLYEVHENDFAETMSCFLWQRSYFYDKAKFSVHGWHLRWFTFTRDSITSVPDRTRSEKYKVTYPRFLETEIDTDRMIIKIDNPKEGKRDFFFLAPSRQIFERVLVACDDIVEARGATGIEGPTTNEDEEDENFGMDGDFQESLIEFPWDGSFTKVFFHIVLFPLKGLMHLTIPDVRYVDSEGNPKGGSRTAFFAVFACLLWLIVGSYAMVASLEKLAELMNIPDAVVGVTVSAAGTSLPNYVASKVAAERGFGNMAVSNAFGSNTFNICMGLGFPWLLYIACANGFQPYSGLPNDGILESVIILATVLLVFVVIALYDNFTLYRWHGILFLVLYASYLAFVIGQVYL